MYYHTGVHYFRVPDPRGTTLVEVMYRLSAPDIGRSVVVEVNVGPGKRPDWSGWSFRYLWASWSLCVRFAPEEEWELVVEKSGPRTEMQVRLLYEMADDMRIRAMAERVSKKWAEVSRLLLPGDLRSAPRTRKAQRQKRMEELEERAIVELKLVAAKARGSWIKRQDPETVLLQGFLQGRVSASLICETYDLDWKACVPLLQGLQDAYDRLVSEALGNRLSAVAKACRRKRITLNEAADILFLDTPIAEDILRIGAIVERKFVPANRPSKKQLVAAIQSIETLRMTVAPKSTDDPAAP